MNGSTFDMAFILCGWIDSKALVMTLFYIH